MHKKRLEKLNDLGNLPDAEENLSLLTFNHSGLNKFRECIKETFLPLLIHTFQLKATQQKEAEEEITKQLNDLKNDLKQLSLWTTSCLTQVEKALLARQEPPQKVSFTAKKSSSPSKLIFSKFFPLPQPDTTSLSQRLNLSGKDKGNKNIFSKLFTLAIRPFSRS